MAELGSNEEEVSTSEGLLLVMDAALDERCPRLPVRCPRNCKQGFVPRVDLAEHDRLCRKGLQVPTLGDGVMLMESEERPAYSQGDV